MRTLGGILLLGLSVALLACQPGPRAASEAAGAAAQVMQFELASLDGRRLRPTDLAEELVLIDFWATWCAPCHLQADILAKLYPELRARGVEFLAISLGEPEALVREFVAKRPFAYPVLVDPKDQVATEYGIFVLPTVVLLDREGTIMYQHEGISTAERLMSAVDEILENRRPAGRL
ncbi:MAG: TlpA family protein disulfide reductase [Thermoanaerobaculia bacterium]